MEQIIGVGWADLFVPTHSIAEMIVRGTLMYAGLFLIVRFVMRRQTGSIGIADILVIVIIADAAQNAFSKDYRSVTEGVFLVLTIVFWDFVIDWLGFRFPILRGVLHPPPLLLVRDGKIVHRNLRAEFVTIEELETQLRKQGVADIADVKAAYIEGDGDISVIEKRSPAVGKSRRRRR